MEAIKITTTPKSVLATRQSTWYARVYNKHQKDKIVYKRERFWACKYINVDDTTGIMLFNGSTFILIHERSNAYKNIKHNFEYSDFGSGVSWEASIKECQDNNDKMQIVIPNT